MLKIRATSMFDNYSFAHDEMRKVEKDLKDYGVFVNVYTQTRGYMLQIDYNGVEHDEILNYIDENFESIVFKDFKDSIVEEVRKDLRERSKKGIEDYGKTLDRTDFSIEDGLQNSYEEVLDLALYIKKTINTIKNEVKKIDHSQQK